MTPTCKVKKQMHLQPKKDDYYHFLLISMATFYISECAMYTSMTEIMHSLCVRALHHVFGWIL